MDNHECDILKQVPKYNSIASKEEHPSNILNNSIYYPDLTDMYEESFQFWDCARKSTMEDFNILKNSQHAEFWDFLGSSDTTFHNTQDQVDTTSQNDEFWDFLKEPSSALSKQTSKNLENQKEDKTNITPLPEDFWDFLKEPTVSVSLNNLNQSSYGTHETTGSNSFKDSGFYEYSQQTEVGFDPKLIEKCSDEEFWDFLKSSSPFKDVHKLLEVGPSAKKATTSINVEEVTPHHAFPTYNSKTYNKPVSSSNLLKDGTWESETKMVVKRNIEISEITNLRVDRQKTYAVNSVPVSNELIKKTNIDKSSVHRMDDDPSYFSDVTKVTSYDTTRPPGLFNKAKQLHKNNSNTSVNDVSMDIGVKPNVSFDTKLPCISSVFSLNAYPDWVKGLSSNQKAVQSTPNSNATNYVSHNGQMNDSIKVVPCKDSQTEKVTVKPSSQMKKRPHATSPVFGSSKFKVTDSMPSSEDILNVSAHTRSQEYSELQKRQKPINESSLKSVVVQDGQLSGSSSIHASSSQVNQTSFTIGTTTNSTTPLYVVLPSDSETLQNPNYSHFFLIVNNTNVVKRQADLVDNSLKNVPILQLNKTDSKTAAVVTANKSSLPNSDPVFYVSQNSLKPTIVTKTSCNTKNVEFFIKPSVVGGSSQVAFPSNNLYTPCSTVTNLSNSYPFFNTSTAQNSSSTAFSGNSFPKQTIISGNNLEDPIQLSDQVNTAFKTKNAQSTLATVKNKINDRSPLKAAVLKTVQLGKDKKAIQQTSVPVKIDSIAKDKELRDLEGNVINYLFKEKQSSDFDMNSVVFEDQHSIMPPLSNAVGSRAKCLQQLQEIPAPNIIFTSSTKGNSISSESLKTTVNPFPPNLNVINVESSHEIPITSANYQEVAHYSKSSSNSNVQNIISPSESTIPNQSFQTVCQPAMPKVLILKGSFQQRLHQNQNHVNLPTNPNTTRKSSTKKSVAKTKKVGRRTVRELLEEQKKSNNQIGKRTKKEVRELRPILKISTSNYCPAILPNTLPAVSSINSNLNALNYTLISKADQESLDKRPNILLLPSTYKPIRKTVYKEVIYHHDFVKDEGALINECQTVKKGGSDFRPRHYNMSELQIGIFKVNDDADTNGRFRSKFKVIFSKRQFLYDFPVSLCNQEELKLSQIWEQMARIVVSFSTVITMDIGDRTIHLSINSPPLICLGRLQVRSGIISNATVYDTPVENNTWSNVIKTTLDHKIILRKRQATKLKSFLYEFDEKFVTLIASTETRLASETAISFPEDKITPPSLKKNGHKGRKLSIRRLPQWDSSVDKELQPVEEVQFLQPNQMCSCRISCRSVRCSCVKIAKSCSPICLCLNCDNPLNILESLGLNLEVALSDSCLFQNVYQIPKFQTYLQREVKLSCCNSFSRIQDCIPGVVSCPNTNCNVKIEFSWCRMTVCFPECQPRNHCSFCGECCFSISRHCMNCNRCYSIYKRPSYCPTCGPQTPSIISADDVEQKNLLNHQNVSTASQKQLSKPKAKPEIVLLDDYSTSKTTTCSEE